MKERDTISATTDPKSRTTPPAGSARVRGRIAAAGLVIAVVAASLAMVMPLASHGTVFICNGQICSASSCQEYARESLANRSCGSWQAQYRARDNTCSLGAACQQGDDARFFRRSSLNYVKMEDVRRVRNCKGKLKVGPCKK